jgi:hypothetical protein
VTACGGRRDRDDQTGFDLGVMERAGRERDSSSSRTDASTGPARALPASGAARSGVGAPEHELPAAHHAIRLFHAPEV